MDQSAKLVIESLSEKEAPTAHECPPYSVYKRGGDSYIHNPKKHVYISFTKASDTDAPTTHLDDIWAVEIGRRTFSLAARTSHFHIETPEVPPEAGGRAPIPIRLLNDSDTPRGALSFAYSTSDSPRKSDSNTK